MRSLLRSLIGIALVQLLASCFAKGNQLQRLIRLAGGVAMAVLLLSRALGFDYSTYAAALRAYSSPEAYRPEGATALSERLDRMLIESECRTYILDKAAARSIALEDAEIACAWSTDGYWYPVSATLYGTQDEQMLDLLESDLGIAPEAVTWKEVSP